MEYLHPALREIYDYELSHGNVVDYLFCDRELSETSHISIYFKFPLRFDIDHFINQNQIADEIARRISYDTHFNSPWIWYSYDELHQQIISPIEYRTLQRREQELQKCNSIDWYSTSMTELLLPSLIFFENLLVFYLLICFTSSTMITFFLSFLFFFFLFPYLSMYCYLTIIAPKFNQNKF
jgi:hypothetical protein